MSSYLTFYVVPKKTRTNYYKDEHPEEKITEGVPLYLLSYSRNSNVYQAYNSSLSPAYAGNEERYTELTPEIARDVAREFEKEEVKALEKTLEVKYKLLKEGGYNEDLASSISDYEETLSENKSTLNELNWIAELVCECSNDYNDFTKVLINID